MKRKAIILGQSIAFFFICSLVLFPYQAIAQTKQLVSLEMDWVMIENGSGFKVVFHRVCPEPVPRTL